MKAASPFESCSISEHWLAQFSSDLDKELARQYLRRLKLISHTDFERGIRDQLRNIVEKVGSENVALFTVSEQVAKIWTGSKERRIAGSSTDLIKQLLENYNRISPKRISSHPTLDSMRAERIKNIVLVEDLVGSGKRLSDYWLQQVPPSVKSWISYKWTKLWVVSYAAYIPGIQTARKTIKSLDKSRFLTVLPPLEPCRDLSPPIMELCKAYVSRTGKPTIPYGYGDCGSTIVFEHGCPNNSPPILWDDTGSWKPLFVGRGIPAGLEEYFRQENISNAAEKLWDSGQYRAALGLLDKKAIQSLPPKELQLLLAISIASRRGWDDKELQGKLMLPSSRIVELRRLAYDLDLIDKQAGKLTGFGRALLSKLKSPGSTKVETNFKAVENITSLYYPWTCEGRTQH